MGNRYVSVLVPLTGQSAGASATLAVATLPANCRIKDAHIEGHEAITFDGTTTGVSGVLGIAGTTNGFLTTAAFASLAVGAMSDLGGNGTLVNRLQTTAPAVIFTITATGGATDVAEIDAGAVWVHIHYETARERIR
jgi:hypothetical protein